MIDVGAGDRYHAEAEASQLYKTRLELLSRSVVHVMWFDCGLLPGLTDRRLC